MSDLVGNLEDWFSHVMAQRVFPLTLYFVSENYVKINVHPGLKCAIYNNRFCAC